MPSFVAMLVLSALYFRSASLPVVQTVFKGLGAVVVAVVLNAGIRLARTSLHGWQSLLIAGLALAALMFHVNFLFVLAGAAVLAVPLYRPWTRGAVSANDS